MSHSSENKSTFETEGFISDYVEEHRSDLKYIYNEEFDILRKTNRLLQNIISSLDPNNSRIEKISNILGVRFCQSLQSSIILISYGVNSDSYSIIRNMQECYLALACAIKDEEYFINISNDDRVKFSNSMIKHIENSSYLKDIYEGVQEKIDEINSRIQSQLKSLNTKKRTDAGTFYDFTQDEWQSDTVYLNYRFISNTHCHISENSLSNHISESGSRIVWRSIKENEIYSAVKYIVDTSVIFGNRLDELFFNKKYAEQLKSQMDSLYGHLNKIGYLVHKDELSKHI
nr:DUF5677 domain-containing protein [Acetobacter persici]